MPRTNLTYTTKEINTIFYMKNKGYTAKEIAEKVKRSTRAIENFIQKYRPLGETAVLARAKDHDTVQQALPSITAAIDSIGFAPEKEEQATNTEVAVDPSEVIKVTTPEYKPEVRIVVKPLSDYPPCELIKHLYNLGYRIKNNEIVQIIERKVLLKDIIGE